VAPPIYTVFCCGGEGEWRIDAIRPVVGETLPSGERLAIREANGQTPGLVSWTLRGVVGHARYVQRREKESLALIQPPLGRVTSTLAAMIPIRKSAAWWDLAQDERRAIIEERSHHISDGMRYLPAIARRLYQSRELGEPFDFLTWFEYAPADAQAFEEITALLRATEEWRYVEREVDIRLSR
jgi:chlorite dismutase